MIRESPWPWITQEARDKDRRGFEDAYGRYLKQLEDEGWIRKWPTEIHGEWVDKPAPKVSWWRRAIQWWRD